MTPCPNCHEAEEREITKNGFTPRKKKLPGTTDFDPLGRAKIQRYVCTKCGYTARGSAFGRSETPEKKEEQHHD